MESIPIARGGVMRWNGMVGMDTRCADDDDDCCAAVPLAGPIDLPYPVLPYLLYLLGYVCTILRTSLYCT